MAVALLPAPRPIVCAEQFFAQAETFRRYLEQFIVLEKVEALFQTEDGWRSKDDGDV